MTKIHSVLLTRSKDCKHSVVFATKELSAPVSSVYVNRSVPGISSAQSVRLSVEVDPAAAASSNARATNGAGAARLQVAVTQASTETATEDSKLLASLPA